MYAMPINVLYITLFAIYLYLFNITTYLISLSAVTGLSCFGKLKKKRKQSVIAQFGSSRSNLTS